MRWLDAVIAFPKQAYEPACSTGHWTTFTDDRHPTIICAMIARLTPSDVVRNSRERCKYTRRYICDAQPDSPQYPDESHASRSRVSPRSIGRSAVLSHDRRSFLSCVLVSIYMCLHFHGNWAPFSRTVPFTRSIQDESGTTCDPRHEYARSLNRASPKSDAQYQIVDL